MSFSRIRTGIYPFVACEKNSNLEVKVFVLEQKMESLLITTEALWEILKEKTNVTEEELLQKIKEIDLRDGKEDNRVAKKAPRRCPKCDRVIKKQVSKCSYCETSVKAKPFER